MNYEVKNVYGKLSGRAVTVKVAGSKSITARAMLIAALSKGVSTLYGAQFSDDCETFLNCLIKLGINCANEGDTLKIEGCGGILKRKSAVLNVGSAGTAARFLPAFLAFCDGEFSLDCSAQMKNRPIKPLIISLEKLGARFSFADREYCYPFTINGTDAPALYTETDISESSQFLSALLMSAAIAKQPVTVKALGSHGAAYIDMTLKMMESFGADVKREGETFTVSGGYTPREYKIEPDISAAAYFYAMNRVLGTNISVEGIDADSLQGDIEFINLLKNFDGGKIDMGAFSDQTLTLAAIAPYFSYPTEITGVAHIRKQECDRIRAIVHNLTAMGVACEERADGVKIYPSAPRPAHVDTFGDHRVAMSFALTGLRADGIVIDGAEVCSKTFKDYFNVLDGVIKELTKG